MAEKAQGQVLWSKGQQAPAPGLSLQARDLRTAITFLKGWKEKETEMETEMERKVKAKKEKKMMPI